MKSFLIFLGFVLIYLNTLTADSIIVQGEVSGDWDVDTVKVADNIFFNSGESVYTGFCLR